MRTNKKSGMENATPAIPYRVCRPCILRGFCQPGKMLVDVSCTFATGTNGVNVDTRSMYTLTRLNLLEFCIFRGHSGCAHIQLLFIAVICVTTFTKNFFMIQ